MYVKKKTPWPTELEDNTGNYMKSLCHICIRIFCITLNYSLDYDK